MKYISYIILVAGVTACSKPSATENTAQPEEKVQTVVTLTQTEQQSLDIQTTSVEQRSLSGNIKVNGMLDVPPQNLVSISAPMGGFVKHTELLQGMKIQKGQVIAIMEHTDYIQLQQDYLDSKNQLEFADLEYHRQVELAKENVNAAKTLQQAKSAYGSMKAKTEGLKARLKMININPDDLEKGEIKNTIALYSPIAGYVTQVNVNIGMYVNPIDVMFRIVDTDHVHAEAQVFEKDVNKLKIGQNVRITMANERQERMAKVYLINKEISPERTVRVHCHLSEQDEHDDKLMPGMYFSAIIETNAQWVNAVPAEALVTFDEKSYVFIAKDIAGQYELVPVSKGITEGGYTEINLPSDYNNAKIVTKGSYNLLSLLKNAE